jgi:hypothetical protein
MCGLARASGEELCQRYHLLDQERVVLRSDGGSAKNGVAFQNTVNTNSEQLQQWRLVADADGCALTDFNLAFCQSTAL